MEDFQPYLDNSLLYTYIGPKEKEHFYTFLAGIYHSSSSHSLYLRLSNPHVVRKILQDLNLWDNTELEIYIATNDQYSVHWVNKTLQQYIREQQIDFYV